MQPPRIVITGGTGFLGRALLAQLAQGSPAPSVLVLSRNARTAMETLTDERAALRANGGDLVTAAWDPEAHGPAELASQLSGAAEVYHLVGEQAVGRRYTEAVKARLMKSRVNSTMRLVEALGALGERPRVLVSASGVGYYGDRPASEPLDESEPAGSDFLALVCVAWESAARAAERLGIRTVQTRFGVVLGQGGGALSVMRKPIELFVGGPLGSGKQAFSWIQAEDAARALIHVARTEAVSGPVNVASPEATTNGAFTRALGRKLGRPTPLSVPAFALRLALGEGAEPLLTGQRAMPVRLLETGFSFHYPKLDEALAASL